MRVGCDDDFFYLVCRGVAGYSTSRRVDFESYSIIAGTPRDICDAHDGFAE